MKKSIFLFTIIFFLLKITFAQEKVIFIVQNFKQRIFTKDDLSFEILFKNNSKKNIKLPKFPIISSLYQHDSDIGYQIYKRNKGFCKIDSCLMLVLPRIPEDGIIYETIKSGQKRIYKETLSWSCFLDTGYYKVRFILKLNKYNKKEQPIYTKWHYFRVSNNLLPKELQ